MAKIRDVNPVTSAIAEECEKVRQMLLDKNRKYGNSALNPLRLFSKSDTLEQIRVRIDDKLSRLRTMDPWDTEDVELDLIGYLILLRVAQRMETSKQERASQEQASQERQDVPTDVASRGNLPGGYIWAIGVDGVLWCMKPGVNSPSGRILRDGVESWATEVSDDTKRAARTHWLEHHQWRVVESVDGFKVRVAHPVTEDVCPRIRSKVEIPESLPDCVQRYLEQRFDEKFPGVDTASEKKLVCGSFGDGTKMWYLDERRDMVLRAVESGGELSRIRYDGSESNLGYLSDGDRAELRSLWMRHHGWTAELTPGGEIHVWTPGQKSAAVLNHPLEISEQWPDCVQKCVSRLFNKKEQTCER